MYAKDGSKIDIQKASITVKNGASGLVSDGGTASVPSFIDVKNGSIEYEGEGFAIYTKGQGKVDLSNGTLTLRGKAVGFEKDLSLAPGNQSVMQ